MIEQEARVEAVEGDEVDQEGAALGDELLGEGQSQLRGAVPGDEGLAGLQLAEEADLLGL